MRVQVLLERDLAHLNDGNYDHAVEFPSPLAPSQFNWGSNNGGSNIAFYHIVSG
jgi:hypothetical protein